MAKAEKENWASPGKYPEWAQRIRFYGDVRTRYEGDVLPKRQRSAVRRNYQRHQHRQPVLRRSSPLQSVFLADLQHDAGSQSCPAPRAARHGGRSVRRISPRACGSRPATAVRRCRPTRRSAAPAEISANTRSGSIAPSSSISAWSDLTISAGRFDNPFFTATDLVWHRDLGFDGIRRPGQARSLPGIHAIRRRRRVSDLQYRSQCRLDARSRQRIAASFRATTNGCSAASLARKFHADTGRGIHIRRCVLRLHQCAGQPVEPMLRRNRRPTSAIPI